MNQQPNTVIVVGRAQREKDAVLLIFLAQAAKELRAMARQAEIGLALLDQAKARAQGEGGGHESAI